MTTQFETYVEALIPDPYVILGVKLKPFSLGHIFLMKKFDCKYSAETPSTIGGIDDLLLGVAICSRTYEDFIDFINGPKEFNGWCRKWAKVLRKTKKINVLKQSILFKEYMKSGVLIPKYWELQEDEDIHESGAHWTQSVFNTLTSNLGYTQSEALNVSVAKAMCDYFKYLETNGIINLMNDDELKQIEEANNITDTIMNSSNNNV